MAYGSPRSGSEERAAACVRWRRLRQFAGVLAIAWLLAPAARAPLSAPRTPEPPTIAFDSLVVSPASFSPNGDGVQDQVTIGYRLRDTTTVRCFVTPLGSSDTVRTLLRDSTETPRAYALIWNGRDDSPDTLVVPDGDYEIHFEGQETTSGALLVNQRRVRVDTRAAVATIDSIQPRVFTPTVAGTPSVQRIGLQVVDSEPGDSLNVRVHIPGSTPRSYRMRLQQNRQDLQGDGFYWVVCDSCRSNSAVPDGIYSVTAATVDAAGNTHTSTGAQIDKDIRGPTLTILHPLAGSVAHVQHADSLVGRAYDRNGVAGVQVEVDTLPLESTGGVPPGDSAYVFVTDLSTALATEGRYRLHLEPVDAAGVLNARVYTMVVDRTPPAKPRLDPRPGPVSKIDKLDVRLTFDLADSVYQVIRTGGSQPADTSRVTTPGAAQLQVLLRPGINALTFAVRDSALNVSPPETLTVAWETSRGLAVPERFHPGNTIQVHMGSVPGNGVEVLVYATDGSLVQRFEDTSHKLVYTFTWNLQNPQGLRVKNGAYLLLARVTNADGSIERFRRLIAVLE